MIRRTLLLAMTLMALPGCDSGLALKADLGQGGSTPAVDALVGTPSTTGQSVTFVSTTDKPYPDAWKSATSLKFSYGGAFLPMVATAGVYVGVIPTTLGTVIAQPTVETPVAFQVDGSRVMVARVTFR